MDQSFADTSYYIALINPHDDMHGVAKLMTAALTGGIVTTAWVVNELANYLARPPNRTLFLEMLDHMRRDPNVSIVPMSQAMFDRGIDLYARRLDKEWSVTDCISFIVMQDHALSDALTSDHHFSQAGFNVLLK